MTNEELIDKIYDHLDAQGTYEAELLRLLNERDELEKLINNIKAWFHIHADGNCEIHNGAVLLFEKEGKVFNKLFVELGTQIYSAKKEVEDSHCCGNCTYYVYRSCHLSGSSLDDISANSYCCHWQPDGLTRKERERK